MLLLKTTCPICREAKDYEFANSDQYEFNRWMSGVVIQQAMPNLEPDEREVFITGMCYDCQSEVFQ